MTRAFQAARHLAAQAHVGWLRWRSVFAPLLPL